MQFQDSRSSLCDSSSGRLVGQAVVIWFLPALVGKTLGMFPPGLSLEPHVPTLKSLTRFLPSLVLFIITVLSCSRGPSLYHDIWLHLSPSPPPTPCSFFMVPCCCEQNSFFKRQMVATLFSLNKKAKQLLRCKQSHGQQIVSASSVGEVSL